MCIRDRFYRIETLDGKGNLIQNFYIPNVTESDVLEWVDTQVKYGETYQYQIYAYHAVLGTAYEYKNRVTNPVISKRTISVDVEYEPSFVLVEVPYAYKRGIMLDSPPVYPDVDIISYIDVPDRIMINLKPNVGDRWRVPVIIDPEEQDYIDSLPGTIKKTEVTQKNNQIIRTLKVRYKSDDPNKKYKVYRIEERPYSYSDFAGTGAIVEPVGKETSASVLDKIVPNKKYYYVFRTIDLHDHLSYPSPVYEIEMVDDHGSIYLLTRVIDFKVDLAKTYTKPFKKYLFIGATETQSTMDLENSQGFKDATGKITDTANNIVLPKLGTDKTLLWNKKYKLRLTSKKTGRKIDVNFKFAQDHKKLNKV